MCLFSLTSWASSHSRLFILRQNETEFAFFCLSCWTLSAVIFPGSDFLTSKCRSVTCSILGLWVSSSRRSSSCSQTSRTPGKISKITYANSVWGGFSLQVPRHTEHRAWLKSSVSLWWPEHVLLSPPTGRSWCCRLWWSGCVWLWSTPSTDAASLWTAMMSGRLPGCCCPEWTASPVSFGTAVCTQPPHMHMNKTPAGTRVNSHTGLHVSDKGKKWYPHFPAHSSPRGVKKIKLVRCSGTIWLHCKQSRKKRSCFVLWITLVCFALQNGWLLLRLEEAGCCFHWSKVPAGPRLPHAQLWTHGPGEAGCQPAGARWHQQHEWAG